MLFDLFDVDGSLAISEVPAVREESESMIRRKVDLPHTPLPHTVTPSQLILFSSESSPFILNRAGRTCHSLRSNRVSPLRDKISTVGPLPKDRPLYTSLTVPTPGMATFNGPSDIT